MKRLLLSLIAISLIAPASAQTYRPGGATTDGNPQPVKTMCWSGSAYVACGSTSGTATDRGAVVTTAGTAQQLMAANASRRGLSVQNQSAGDCYISSEATATANYHSLKLAAGAYYETSASFAPSGAISIVCSSASASVYAREW